MEAAHGSTPSPFSMNPFRSCPPALAAMAFLVWVGVHPAAIAEAKPNVLFLFADDQAFSTIHALGNDEIETPNLDRLVARSTTFTHAYNMGSWSGAVCVASRTMLNTGRFIWRAQATDLEQARAEEVLWSQLLNRAGYDTYFTGKWHVRLDANRIFTVANHIRPGMPKQTPEGYDRPREGEPDPWDPADPKFGGFWEGGRHWSEIVADDAENYLETAAADDDPFFLYVAFNAPHDPRQSPREYLERYPAERISLPANFVPEYPFNEAMKSGRKLRDERLAPFPRTEHAVRIHRREYYAIITHLDTQIGRILDALEASGEGDDTYVFYSADHGLAVGEHGLIGKQNMYDHSLRVPLLLSGPGVPNGIRNESPVYLQDIMATTLDLAEAPRPEHVEFRSLLPLLEGESDGYESIYGAYLDSQRAIIHGRHKLIVYPRVPVALLFDLQTDPHETENLAKNPENLPLVKELFRRLVELQEEMGDDLDLEPVFPQLAS